MSSPPPGEADATADPQNQEAAAPARQRQERQRQPSLLDSLLVNPGQKQNATDAGFGILCNDPTGLCLSATGSFVNGKDKDMPSLANMDDALNSGVYTSLTKLAQQLQPAADAAAAPLITIECEDSNFLIKEYDGHAIALKVPVAPPPTEGGEGSTNGESPTAADGAAPNSAS